MSKQPVLKLNGKPFSLRRESSVVVSLRAHLDKAPSDELFTSDELAARFGAKRARDYMKELGPYTYKVGAIRYWGNPKAITSLKAQVGE